jgi:hypothetical protein
MSGLWSSSDAVLSIDADGDTITLIQLVVSDGDLRSAASAAKMIVHADDRDRPAPFGEGLSMRSRWADRRTLETIVSRGDVIVSQGAYVVSGDGSQLTVSTPQQQLVFARA